MMKKVNVMVKKETTAKVTRPTAQLSSTVSEKEKIDRETVQILVDDRVATGG